MQAKRKVGGGGGFVENTLPDDVQGMPHEGARAFEPRYRQRQPFGGWKCARGIPARHLPGELGVSMLVVDGSMGQGNQLVARAPGAQGFLDDSEGIRHATLHGRAHLPDRRKRLPSRQRERIQAGISFGHRSRGERTPVASVRAMRDSDRAHWASSQVAPPLPSSTQREPPLYWSGHEHVPVTTCEVDNGNDRGGQTQAPSRQLG